MSCPTSLQRMRKLSALVRAPVALPELRRSVGSIMCWTFLPIYPPEPILCIISARGRASLCGVAPSLDTQVLVMLATDASAKCGISLQLARSILESDRLGRAPSDKQIY